LSIVFSGLYVPCPSGLSTVVGGGITAAVVVSLGESKEARVEACSLATGCEVSLTGVSLVAVAAAF
jgi:hypothetical protein